MKKILLSVIAILVSLPVFSQRITNDTLPSLPYSELVYHDFENSLVDSSDVSYIGWTGFNGGSVTHQDTVMRVIGSSAARGALFGYTNEGGKQYKIEMHVVDPGSNGISVYSQWATEIADISTAGWYTLKFTADESAGGFGNKIVLSMNAADTALIGFFRLSELNEHRDILHKTEIEELVSSSSGFYGNVFGENIDGVSFFGVPSAPTLPNTSKQLEVTTTGSSQITTFNAGNFSDTMDFNVFIDFERVDVDIALIPVWGTSERKDTLTSSGKYYKRFRRSSTQGISSLNGFGITTVGSGTFRINEIQITPTEDNAQSYRREFRFGDNMNVGEGGTNTNLEYQVIIGNDIEVTSVYSGGNTLIGDGIQVGLLRHLVGTGLTTAETAVFGIGGKAAGARTSSFGVESMSLGQSSTAVGSGAEAWMPHSFSLGRGAYLNSYPVNVASSLSETGDAINFGGSKMYFKNGWSHRTPEPLSNQTRGTNTPASEEAEIHGLDAFDARYPQWQSGTTYNKESSGDGADIVYQSGNLYYSLTTSNVGNDPTSSPTHWALWMADSQGAAADFNVDGGHIGHYAGRATGTGTSGEIRFYGAKGSNGDNVKDTPYISMYIDSAEDSQRADGTDLFVVDRSTNTLRRVLIKEPANSGSRNVIGFKRLLLN